MPNTDGVYYCRKRCKVMDTCFDGDECQVRLFRVGEDHKAKLGGISNWEKSSEVAQSIARQLENGTLVRLDFDPWKRHIPKRIRNNA